MRQDKTRQDKTSIFFRPELGKKHRKLLASTTLLPSLLGAAIALPIIGVTTPNAIADNIKSENGTPSSSADTSFDNGATNTHAIEVINGTLTLTGNSITADSTVANKSVAYAHNSGNLVINNDFTGEGANLNANNALFATGSGSSITLHGNADLTVHNTNSFGIKITAGANVTADNADKTVTIHTDGNAPAAIILANSSFTSAGTVVINTDSNSDSRGKGVLMNDNNWSPGTGGSAEFNILDITTDGEGSIGVDIRNQGQFSVNDLTIKATGGRNAYGVLASNDGTLITIKDANIQISAPDPNAFAGFGSSALRARSESEIDITGDITIETNIVGGEGIQATGGAVIKLDNAGHTTHIVTNSNISAGVGISRLEHSWETGSGSPYSTVISNGNLDITTNSATSVGIGVTGEGASLQTGDDSSTTIHSAGSAIKFQAGTNQSITLHNANITSDGAAGVYGIAPGQIEDTVADGYAEHHLAVNSDGNLFQVGGKDNIENFVSGGPTTAVYNSIEDNTTNSSLTLLDSIAKAGGGKLLMDVRSSGSTGSTFTFTNTNTELHGGVATQAGSTLDMNLGVNSSWYIDQNSNLTNLVNDHSSIHFDHAGTTFNSLTVNNYTGTNDAIHFNTQLGNDASPTDQLIIDGGSATGTTAVYINNAGGGGGQTTGNGIKLVDAINNGTTGNDAFALGAPVNAGLFTYNLQRGGLAANVATDNDWFLRSEYRNETPAVADLSVAGWQIVLSSLPTLHDRYPDIDGIINTAPDTKQANLVSPAKSTFAALHQGEAAFQNISYTSADQRRISLNDAGQRAATSSSSTVRKGVWGRIIGQDLNYKSHDNAGTGFDGNIWGIQAGLDFYAKVKRNGMRSLGGVYLANASTSGDIMSNTGNTGKLDMDATSLGMYFTKYSPQGWYLDAVAQYSWLHSIKARTAGETLKPNGSSVTLSLESGKQLNPDDKFVWEPQAQLVYSHNDLDDVTLSDSTQIHISNLNAATGRLGIRLFQNPRQAGKLLPWINANVWHTFSANSTISSSGVNLQTPIGGTVGEIKAGVSTKSNNSRGWGLNASLGYMFNLGGADYSGLEGTLGLRKNW